MRPYLRAFHERRDGEEEEETTATTATWKECDGDDIIKRPSGGVTVKLTWIDANPCQKMAEPRPEIKQAFISMPRYDVPHHPVLQSDRLRE